VPVILMTAHGSEAMAIEALDRGAASYVPKSRLADKLLSTVEEVLALAGASRSHEQVLSCLGRCELVFYLENEPSLVDALVDLVQQMVEGMRLCDFTGRLRIGLALKEALLNALFHGNLEISREDVEKVQHRLIGEKDRSLVEQRRERPPYRDRRIHVEIKLSRAEIRLMVRDEGKGFDVTTVPKAADPAALEGERGRGLSLIRAFMDEVIYNEAGNEVTLVKRGNQGQHTCPS
jgi:anti-sigma regulatory factor (Ser/Thr protein kinase)